MMRTLRFNWIVLAVSMVSIMFFTWSCGGGGGGGGDTPAPQQKTPATMDQNTAKMATAMGMSLGDINDISGSYLDQIGTRAVGPDSQQALSLFAWVMNNLHEAYLAGNVINENIPSRAGSGGDSGNCAESGSFNMSGTWSGPNDPGDACEVSNATVTFAFSNCREYGDLANGTVTIHVDGNLCTPTAISMNFRGFSATSNSYGIAVNANNFDLAMTAMQFSGDVLTHAKMTLNGDIAVNSFNMQFSQFIEDVTSDGSSQTVSVSGSVTGDCLDGWVTFTTLSPIQGDASGECPIGGSVQLSGDLDMVVSFNSDGSLSIDNQTYPSCQDLPDTCQ
jgi:hypothetical protein